jgi:prepilin-type N-terminal cleavage/methylation domain-containing protein
MMTRRGFTLLEMLLTVSIMSAVLAGIMKLWLSGQQSAATMMQVHQVQEDMYVACERIMDDIRESNVIIDPGTTPTSREPPFFTPQGASLEEAVETAVAQGALKMSDPRNRLVLLKCQALPPAQVGNDARRLFQRYRIEYFLEPDPEKPSSFALVRRSEELNASGEPIGPSSRVKTLLEDIDGEKEFFVFFRVSPTQGAPSARDLFFSARRQRRERAGESASSKRYTTKILHSAHIRGTVPDYF